jgi:hypothetical protein
MQFMYVLSDENSYYFIPQKMGSEGIFLSFNIPTLTNQSPADIIEIKMLSSLDIPTV